MKNYLITTDIDEVKWDNFVDQHPLGNIFQTSSMYRVFKNTRGYAPYRFWCIHEKTQEVLGILQGVILSEKQGILGQLSSRAIIQGGPLLANKALPNVAKDLIGKFDQEIKTKAVWSEIRNLADNKPITDSIKSYKLEDHLNFLINLTQSEEEMWTKVRPTRRKNIRSGQKQNRLIIASNLSQVNLLYDLIDETYDRVKLPLTHKSLFLAAWKELSPKGMAKIFLAKSGQAYTGGRLILIYKNTLYDWYAGTKTDQIGKHPNDFLIWKILQWGRTNGYKTFDFGGAGKPNVPYGPRDFKRQFGGELVNFGWMIKIYSPWKYHLAHWGLSVYQWVSKQAKGK